MSSTGRHRPKAGAVRKPSPDVKRSPARRRSVATAGAGQPFVELLIAIDALGAGRPSRHALGRARSALKAWWDRQAEADPDPARKDETWRDAWLASRHDPKRFVTGVLGAEPESWQAKALDDIGRSDRVAIRSGHGVGKTALVAWVVLWFLLTRFPSRIPVTANSQDQLRDIVWPEIKRWHRKLPRRLGRELDCGAERVAVKSAPERGFAVARTANREKPEALQGFHAENLLFVLEEASGIDDVVFEVAQGALSTPGAKVLMVSNPTRLSGFFHDSFHRLRERWTTMKVSSEDVLRARGHIGDIVARYGRESNAYRVRVQGDFPTCEDEQIVPLEWVEAAVRRDVKPAPSLRPVWGVDVARFGDDRTALAKRRANVLLESIKWWRGKDTMQVAGLVKAEWEATHRGERPSEILVDVIGLGAGVVDRLAELGLPVRGVNVGESPAASDRYLRLRDELWFKTREWFQARDCRIADDAMLIAELTQPAYGFTSAGKIVIESKDDLKKRGLPSPDVADAFVLTFAGGLDRVEERDRYRKRRPRPQSWMAA